MIKFVAILLYFSLVIRMALSTNLRGLMMRPDVRRMGTWNRNMQMSSTNNRQMWNMNNKRRYNMNYQQMWNADTQRMMNMNNQRMWSTSTQRMWNMNNQRMWNTSTQRWKMYTQAQMYQRPLYNRNPYRMQVFNMNMQVSMAMQSRYYQYRPVPMWVMGMGKDFAKGKWVYQPPTPRPSSAPTFLPTASEQDAPTSGTAPSQSAPSIPIYSGRGGGGDGAGDEGNDVGDGFGGRGGYYPPYDSTVFGAPTLSPTLSPIGFPTGPPTASPTPLGSASPTMTPRCSSDNIRVADFVMVNADVPLDPSNPLAGFLFTITEQAAYSISNIKDVLGVTNLGIVCTTDPYPIGPQPFEIGSVGIRDNRYRSHVGRDGNSSGKDYNAENEAPYALADKGDGKINPTDFTVGFLWSITCQAFCEPDLLGDASAPVTRNFIITP